MKLLLILVEGELYLAAIVGIFLAEALFLAWGVWSRRPLLGLVAVFGMLPLMRTTIGAIRALLFRTRAPEGVGLERSAAPRLYDVVEDIRRGVGAPRVHAVTITAGFDAAASVCASMWPVGRRRTLVLGLPVLATLSQPELRAVIAHELAHFAGVHNGFAGWVYRTRRGWFDLYSSLNRRMATPLYVSWLIRWYIPRLNVASARIARQQELEADRVAARVAGSRAAADALIVYEAGARFADRVHWPRIDKSFAERPEPPRPFSDMLAWNARLSTAHDPETLESLFVSDTSDGDTHPSMRERFATLGEDARMPPPIERTAGSELLGDHLAAIARDFDERWLTQYGATWRQRREEFLARTARLEHLSALDHPTLPDLFERAQLLETLRGAGEALVIFQRAAKLGHAASTLAAGRLLLDVDDPEGIPMIEDAMTREDHLVPEGCRVLADYYERTDQELAARKCEWRATRHATRTKLAARSEPGSGPAL